MKQVNDYTKTVREGGMVRLGIWDKEKKQMDGRKKGHVRKKEMEKGKGGRGETSLPPHSLNFYKGAQLR